MENMNRYERIGVYTIVVLILVAPIIAAVLGILSAQ